MSAVETRSPNNNGPVCTIILRNPAGPSATDSATIGRMKESKVAPAQIAAFVAMSFFFADGVILIFSVREELLTLATERWRSPGRGKRH